MSELRYIYGTNANGLDYWCIMKFRQLDPPFEPVWVAGRQDSSGLSIGPLAGVLDACISPPGALYETELVSPNNGPSIRIDIKALKARAGDVCTDLYDYRNFWRDETDKLADLLVKLETAKPDYRTDLMQN